MGKLKITSTAILLGVLYAYLSIYIIGIGAAIAIPSSILEPVMSSVPLFAFAMIDIFTIGLPLIIVYFLFVVIFKYLSPTSSWMPYAILFIPFCIQHVYIFLIMGTPQDWAFSLSTIVPRYILVVFFAFVFTKQAMKRAEVPPF